MRDEGSPVALTCPRCSAANPPTMKYCGQCGAPLSLACPHCEAANPPGFTFCGQCGRPLAVAATATTPLPRRANLEEGFAALRQAMPVALRDQLLTPEEGENRLVTVLFVDLSGSVSATVQLHPEDAATLLEDVLQVMVDAILAHGGRINQFLGDAVLAFFGTPHAHENDPERAIQSALQIRDAVQSRGLNVTAGINAGEVYLGEIGRGPQQDVRAVGTAVNLAAGCSRRRNLARYSSARASTARPARLSPSRHITWR